MNSDSIILGIDVSSESLDIYSSTTGEYFSIQNSRKVIIDFLKKFNTNNVVIFYEATGCYSSQLLKICNEIKVEHYQIHPTYLSHTIKGFGNKNKSDKIDSKLIAMLGIMFIKEMDNITLPSSNMIKNYLSKISRINSMKNLQVKYKNLIHKESKDAFTDDNIVTFYKSHVNDLDQQISDTFEDLETELVENGYEEKIFNLQTIPGLGAETSLILLVFFIDMANKGIQRSDVGKIKAYAGLNPIERQSGTSLNKTNLSKSGRSLVRKTLYMPALQRCKLISNEKYLNTNIGQFVIRMKNKFESPGNKRGKSVATATMKKLLLTGWGIFWSDEQYSFD